MKTENLKALKIHKLTEEQLKREKEAGRLDDTALYLTPSVESVPLMHSPEDEGKFLTIDAEGKVVADELELDGVVYSDDEDHTGGTVPLNADTLGGLKADHFATKESLQEKTDSVLRAYEVDPEVAVAPVDADTLGGRLASDFAPAGDYATKAYVDRTANPKNLLDNSDFSNPVNQSRKTTYTGKTYTIDRWQQTDTRGNLTIRDECVNFASTSTSDPAYIRQTFLKPLNGIYTIAVKAKGNGGGSAYLSSNESSAGAYAGSNSVNIVASGETWAINTAIVNTADCTKIPNQIGVSANAGGSVDIAWVALYEGAYTVDTLPEYQPKGYDYEMLICSQYDPKTGDYVGVAPAGFVSSNLGRLTNTDLGNSLLTILDNMPNNSMKVVFFEAMGSENGSLPSYYYYFVTLYRYEVTGYYYVDAVSEDGKIKARNRFSSGKWEGWAYENPPMNIGVEYLTTERWGGQPVYRKRVSLGNLPASKGELAVPVGVTAGKCVCISLWAYNSSKNLLLPIPYTEGSYVCGYNYNGENINISVTDGFSGYTVTGEIIYIK